MSDTKYFTKSIYKKACECPTKTYYYQNKRYGDKALDDPFLKALARGGYQVGALAQLYYPEGQLVETLDTHAAIEQTNELLKNDNVILFEAAIAYEDLLIRVDILKKTKGSIELIEVKSKSIDPSDKEQFYDKRELKKGKTRIVSKWQPYLYDIAFQKTVAQKRFSDASISCSLMLADKTSVATVEGLNQKFLIKKSHGRQVVTLREGTSRDALGEEVLVKINVDEEIKLIQAGEDFGKLNREQLGRPEYHTEIADWASAYLENKKLKPDLGTHCKSCEFRITQEMIGAGKKSGFRECWNVDESVPLVIDLWNYRKSKDLIDQGIKLMAEIQEDDVEPTEDSKPGMSQSERQWIQVSKTIDKDESPYVDFDNLNEELEAWDYPLNFIDFETTMVAIPFNAGRRPYEQIAFQFSHHTLREDGTVEHANQYINTKRGEFPNFDFVRQLKKALSKNEGSIFRYSNHENTVLLQIHSQLQESEEKDKNDLCDWIETITRKKQGKIIVWQGDRNMIDLWEIVKRTYYHPFTNGSNSIKYVLPAILRESDLLQDLYSKPVYGKKSGIKSFNFKDWQWLKKDTTGNLIDPYRLLGPIIRDHDNDEFDSILLDEDEIADGGAAMVAYAMMQFSEMKEIETKRIQEALLRYCELDTLAMVMISQYWIDIVKKWKSEAA